MIPDTVEIVPFLSRFEKDQRTRLLQLGRPLVLREGEVLFRRGQPGREVFLVQDGTLAVVDPRTTPETVLEVIGPGALVGELGFLDGRERDADVSARTETGCITWIRAELDAAFEAEPTLGHAWYREVGTVAASRVRNAKAAFPPRAPVAPANEAGSLDWMESLLRRVRGTLNGTGTGDDASADEAVRGALQHIGWWIGKQDPGRAAELVVEARARLTPLLALSRTGSLLLQRADGLPAPGAFHHHVTAGRPEGDGMAGLRLDRALLGTPTLAGIRWRVEAAAAELDLGRPARAMAVGAANGGLMPRLLAARARSGGSLLVVEDTAVSLQEVRAALAGADATLRVEDLVRLASGHGDAAAEALDLVVVDGLFDLMPDRLVAGLGRWAAARLAPGGRLVVTHALPAEDGALLGEVLRWPILERPSSSLAALLGAPGRLTVRPTPTPGPGVAGAVLCLERA